MNTYYSSYNYFPNLSSKNLHVIKHDVIIPMELQQALLSLSTCESVIKNDPNLTNMQTLEYIDIESLKKIYKENNWIEEMNKIDSPMVNHRLDLIFPFPLNARVLYQSNLKKYDPKTKTLLIISKPYLVDGLKFGEAKMMEMIPKFGSAPKKMKVYPVFNFIMMKYKKIDEKKFLFSQVHILNLGGWTTNENLFKMVAKSRGSNYRENMKKLELKYPEGSRIKDFEEYFSKEKDGRLIDGLGKQLCDLKIDEKDEEYNGIKNVIQ